MRTAAVLCAVGIVLTLPAAVQAVGEPKLIGTVRDDFTIDLKHPNGDPVTSVAPGTYDFEIHDESTFHNFHLTGPPNLDRRTEVGDSVTVVWEDVVLQPSSTFTYVCDPHFNTMKGSFTTTGGAPPQPPPPGPPPPGPPPPGPPPPGPPPPPGSPPPPPSVHRLQVTGVKVSVVRRGPRRLVVARARVNHLATARLALVRGGRTRASARKTWAAGLNRIQAAIPRPVARGRWTAVLRVGNHRFRRNLRIG